MKNIKTHTQLKNAISSLEIEQEEGKQILKQEFHAAYIKIRNVSIIANVGKGIMSVLGNNAVGNSTGFAAGYLVKKLVVGKSENKFRKVLGTVLQFGTARLVSQNPQLVTKAGLLIMRLFPRKKQVDAN
jgi:hypothetical protein